MGLVTQYIINIKIVLGYANILYHETNFFDKTTYKKRGSIKLGDKQLLPRVG